MKKLGKEFIDALKMYDTINRVSRFGNIRWYVEDDRVVCVSRVGNIRWYVEDDRIVE